MEDYVTLLHIQLKETWNFVTDRFKRNNIKQKYDRINRTSEGDVGIRNDFLIRPILPKNKQCPYLHGSLKVTKIDGANMETKDTTGKTVRAHKNDVRISKKNLEGDSREEQKNELANKNLEPKRESSDEDQQ
uniref:MADF domain-containing protein n=1 Tax=Heterorhabditis bacteriophora TaxID=37862 RepID=A0A1I7XSP1_HETBA